MGSDPGSDPIRRPGPGATVVVVGLQASGRAAAQWLVRQGCWVRVTESQSNKALRATAQALKRQGIVVELGRHTKSFLKGADLVVASPGVPATAPVLQWAREKEIPVISELELGSWFVPGKQVAVTGSNGKSTVVSWLGAMLKAAAMPVQVCGNIGTPITEVLPKLTSQTTTILEVSSFQSEIAEAFNPDIACCLNITQNHLDRHGSFAAYQQAKAQLFAQQQSHGVGVLNADDPGALALAKNLKGQVMFFSRKKEVPGAYLHKGEFILNLPGKQEVIGPVSLLPQLGPHHEANALAVLVLAGLCDVPVSVMRAGLQDFQGLKYRQEPIAQIHGVTFVNDSKATTVTSGYRAIEAAKGPVVLIAGGRDKGSDFKLLKPLSKKLKAFVAIGEDGRKIAQTFGKQVPVLDAKTMQAAVEQAYGQAQAGETVLLSPMCTSFDMFQNFEARGEAFNESVQRLITNHQPPITKQELSQ